MDLKKIQGLLAVLRDKIKEDGQITPETEAELRTLIFETLQTANAQLHNIQGQLNNLRFAQQAGNDNALDDGQKARLNLLEKLGSGSQAVH